MWRKPKISFFCEIEDYEWYSNLWSEIKVSRSTVRMWLSIERTQDTDLLFRLNTWGVSSDLKSTSMIVSSLVSNSEKKHLTEQEGSAAIIIINIVSLSTSSSTSSPRRIGEDHHHHHCHYCCHHHHNHHHHSHHLAGQVGNAALLGGEHHVGRVVEERLVQAQEVVQILTRRRFIKELWRC